MSFEYGLHVACHCTHPQVDRLTSMIQDGLKVCTQKQPILILSIENTLDASKFPLIPLYYLGSKVLINLVVLILFSQCHSDLYMDGLLNVVAMFSYEGALFGL